MAKRALSVAQVSALKAPGVHWCAPSLYSQIRPDGTRSWLFRYERAGRNYWHGLGSQRDVGLKDARDRAEALRVAVRGGADPLADKRAAKAEAAKVAADIPTFDDCAAKFIAAHEAGWRSAKHADQWASTLKMYAGPVIGQMPVDQIAVADVMKIVEPIWVAKPETASRTLDRIARVLGWAEAHGYRSGINPAKRSGPIGHLLPPLNKVRKVVPRRSVPYGEVPAVVAGLLALGSTSAKATVFAVLTGARTQEAIGAQWSEIDSEAKVWTVPATRMKGGKEHRVALSAQAVALIEAQGRDSEYIFPGGRPGKPLSNMAMIECLQGLRGTNETVHGFRSSFSTWAAECTDHDSKVVEAALAHATGGAVELSYMRSDRLERRRALMQDWADHCMGARR